jgi:hypothetical protein
VIANKREEQTPSCGGKKKRHSSSMLQVKLDVANTSSLNESIYTICMFEIYSPYLFLEGLVNQLLILSSPNRYSTLT